MNCAMFLRESTQWAGREIAAVTSTTKLSNWPSQTKQKTQNQSVLVGSKVKWWDSWMMERRRGERRRGTIHRMSSDSLNWFIHFESHFFRFRNCYYFISESPCSRRARYVTRGGATTSCKNLHRRHRLRQHEHETKKKSKINRRQMRTRWLGLWWTECRPFTQYNFNCKCWRERALAFGKDDVVLFEWRGTETHRQDAALFGCLVMRYVFRLDAFVWQELRLRRLPTKSMFIGWLCYCSDGWMANFISLIFTLVTATESNVQRPATSEWLPVEYHICTYILISIIVFAVRSIHRNQS